MILALRVDHWIGIQHRYETRSNRKMKFPYGLVRPNVMSFCQFEPMFHYDAIRLMDGSRLRLRRRNEMICYHCHGYDLKSDPRLGTLICVRCGTVTSERHCDQEYTQFSTNSSQRVYRNNYIKRYNHFKYWLQRLQGNETHRITRRNLEQIKKMLDEQPNEPITFKRIRLALRKSGYQRFYNNTYYLLKYFTGKGLFELQPDHERQLLDLFRRIQESYAEHRDHRINMLSYPYLIRKFAELLEWDEIIFQIPSLQSRDKLRDHDIIWKKICESMQFPFYSSV